MKTAPLFPLYADCVPLETVMVYSAAPCEGKSAVEGVKQYF
jgi:hypothetical protein